MGEEDLRWLVRSRSEIQALCLSLYEVREGDHLEPPQSHVYQLLVGAAFSLWRAVFLSDEGREEPAIQKSAREFLKEVIETNAVSFGTDRAQKTWVFGYYLNNAFFRLDLAYGNLGDGHGLPLRDDIGECIDRQGQGGQHSTFRRKEWDLALKAAQDVLGLLKSRLA